MNWNEFDEVWRERHQEEFLRRAISFFQNAAPDTAEDEYAWWWRRARLSHFCAMQADEENRRENVLRFYDEGTMQARRAIGVNRFGVEGHFWLGVNSLESARRKGALALGTTFSAASKSVEQALKIDETYHFAGPVRVWGRIQQMKPLIMGGSLDNALASYRRALQIAPENSTTLLYYAQALWADRQPKLARQACEKIIAAPDDPDWRWEQARDRKIAATLLAEINRARDT
jgi:tetratricopeptide (TPR) repeat protein